MSARATILLVLAAALVRPGPTPAIAQTWVIQSVDVGGARAGTTALGLDPSGTQDYPLLSYLGAPRNLKYAALDRQTRVWGLTRVDAGGEFSSLDVDRNGIVHVAYLDGATQELKYWRRNQGQSAIQVVDTGVGEFNSIRVDGSVTPTPHVSYWRANSAGITTPDRLRIADYNGTAWAPSYADPTPPRGRYNSLVVDGAGNPAIAYYDADTSGLYSRRLRVLERIGVAAPVYGVVDTVGAPGRFNSIQLNASALARISYIASTASELRFASQSVAGNLNVWLLQDVASVGSVTSSSVTSLALDSGGNPHIAFYDALTDSVRYASRSGVSTWTVVGVDAVGNGGGYCSLRLDRQNQPIISYYDATTQSVKIAYGNYPDADGDGIPDVFDAFPADPDHNHNGILDGREGGVTQGVGTGRLTDEPIFGCGSLAALYGARPPGGGPPPADLLFLLGPAAFLLYRRTLRRRAA